MQFDSKPIEEHREVPLADEGRWEDLVAHWQQREGDNHPDGGRQRSYVASVVLRNDEFPPAREAEILALVRSQGDMIVGHEVCRLSRPDARALFRTGRAADLGRRASECGANLLIVDAHLSPSQTRNLEDATGLPVRDREAVILNVFQRHVKTRRARIQVEIAHLEYLRPRIRGLGLQMDQQAGGIVGSRGPGETASELLARQLDGRLAILRRAFATMARESAVQRKRRTACRNIALVGYTNAGKTSLMNALAGTALSAADQPFETLDTTSRCLSRHGGDVLLSDTVGFIRDLPERLFASFESTLAEIADASVLALVVDVSDPERELHLRETESVLARLGAESVPRFYAFTKVDRLATSPKAATLERLSSGHPYLAICTQDPVAVGTLKNALLDMARADQQRCEVLVPYQAIAATALIYARARVLQAEPTEMGMRFSLEAPAHCIAAIQNCLAAIQNAGARSQR